MEEKIPTFEEAFERLELPEYLNGLEIHYKLNIIASKKKKGVLVETCRRVQDLYDEICAARFALVTACKGTYPEYLSADTDEKGHLWIQSQFVNTAILWYNATYDILLQVVWIYYELYKEKELSLCNIEEVLWNCTEKKVKALLSDVRFKNTLMSFHSKPDSDDVEFILDYKNNSKISEMANTLKHRRMIEYKELSERRHTACFITLSRLPEIIVKGQPHAKQDVQEEIAELYNSNKTLKQYKMNDVIISLFEYHKDICKLSKLVVDKIEF